MGSGECGRCCGDIQHFVQGCPGGQCGGKGHAGGAGGGGGQFIQGGAHGEHGNASGSDHMKNELKSFVKEGKGLISKFLK